MITSAIKSACFSLFLLTSVLAKAQAGSFMGKSNFLDMVMKGAKLEDQSILGPVDIGVMNQVMASQRAKYKNFKDNMMYAKVLKDGDVYHSLIFDYTANECRYGYIDMSRFKSPLVSGEELKFLSEDKAGNVTNSNSSVIDVKYCEKAYSFYAK